MKKQIMSGVSFLGILTVTCFSIGVALADSSDKAFELATNLLNPADREITTKRLISSGDAALPELEIIINSNDKDGPQTRAKVLALNALGQMRSNGASKLVETALGDTNPHIRGLALKALCSLYRDSVGDKNRVVALISQSLLDEADEPRVEAINAIVQVAGVEAVTPLLETARREFAKPSAVRGAPRSKDFFGPDSTIDTCLSRLESLGINHSGVVAAAALNSAKQSNDPDMGYFAAYLAYRLNVKPVNMDTLLEGLAKSTSPRLQIYIAYAFGDIGNRDERVIAALTPLLQSDFKVLPPKVSPPEVKEWIYPLRLAAKNSLDKL